MTYSKKFTSQDGKIFVINEVIQTPAGLTVYYANENTNEQYSCLIGAFSERYKEIQND